MEPDFDAIVVGSGATGGWAAKHLTEAGWCVLLVEAGPPVCPQRVSEVHGGGRARLAKPEHGSTPSGPFEWARRRQPVQSTHDAYREDSYWLFADDLSNPYLIASNRDFRWIRSQILGGRTNLWNRVSPRFSDYQFQPALSGHADNSWPIAYGELAYYYDLVETYAGVIGGPIDHPDVPDNRFFLHRKMSGVEMDFKSRVETAWRLRRVATTPEFGLSRPAGAPEDPAGPFFSSVGSTIPDARRTGRLTLRCNSFVERVLWEERVGRALGVSCVDRETGVRSGVTSRVVFLCASTLESTRLLLLSGLGSRCRALGRGLMDHVRGARLIGRRPAKLSELEEAEQRGPTGRIYIPPGRIPGRHRERRNDYQIQGTLFTDVSRGVVWCSLRAFGEMARRDSNHVTLHPEHQDAWGVPVLQIDCAHSRAEHDMVDRQAEDCGQIMDAAGYTLVSGKSTSEILPPGAGAHELGTACMGDHPENSVLNRYNECWAVKNLFVTDGASFATSGFQNPTLTMMALTARACDHVLARS
jgi:choline dehydrogenase-like flavoprotein